MSGFALNDEVRERLVEAARLAAVGRLVPSFVHQMNTPLAAIALRVESLGHAAADPGPPLAPEKARRYLQAMGEETERCRQLLSVLRLFAARAEPGDDEVDLGDLCRSAVLLVHHEAMRRQIEIRLELGRIPLVQGRKSRLGQALLALLLNAVDASPQGGHVGVDAREEPVGEVALAVVDEGEGVREDARAGLFEPFATTRPPEQGLGLGLMACRAIARDHGGTLEWQTSPRGSRFVLRVPVSRPDGVADRRRAPGSGDGDERA